jgi:hypothetical protein
MNRAQAKLWEKARQHIGTRPRRLLASHCPGCCKPLERPAMQGCFADDHGTHVVFYYLCAGCARELTRNPKTFSARIEQNLMRLGGHGHVA